MPKNREVLMDEEKRSNQNYEIIESCTIGSTELVIGHNPNAPNPLMCVGTARAAQIISGVIIRMSLMMHGKTE